MIRLGWAELPMHVTWRQLYGVSLICGIGFTMSLFIGLLAFPDDVSLQNSLKMGVLAGALASGLAGWLILRVVRGRPIETDEEQAAAPARGGGN